MKTLGFVHISMDDLAKNIFMLIAVWQMGGTLTEVRA